MLSKVYCAMVSKNSSCVCGAMDRTPDKRPAGIVDEHIDAAKLCQRLLDHVRAPPGIADIGW